MRSAALIFCMSVAFALTGCETSGSKNEVAARSEPASQTQTIGEGATKTALLLPFSGPQASQAQQIRNGALLAYEDLGKDDLTLAIYDTANDSARIREITTELQAENVSFAAILASEADFTPIAESLPLTVAIAQNQAQNGPAFRFLPGEMDSLAAGIRYASAGRGERVVLFAPDDFAAENVSLLKSLLGNGFDISRIDYGPRESAGNIIRNAQKEIAETRIFAFAGNTTKVADFAKGVTLARTGMAEPIFVGHSAWDPRIFKRKELDGAIVGLPDTSQYALISERYENRYGSDLTPFAAYGYDLFAVVSGLVRAQGNSALKPAAVISPTGFRGVSGAFRFTEARMTERLFAYYVVRDGKLAKLDDAPLGF